MLCSRVWPRLSLETTGIFLDLHHKGFRTATVAATPPLCYSQ